MSVLSSVLSNLTPAQHNAIPYDEYQGLQYKWKIFVFRPALFQTELYLLGAVAFYVLWTFYGQSVNSRKANKWFETHLPLLKTQFSSPTVGSLTQDGYSDYFNFSTGRRNVASLHSIVTLFPRHDLFQYLYHTLWTLVDLQYRPQDDLQLDFKLFPSALPYDFVWGLVAKDELLTIKNDRWDLTFTKTTENSAVPQRLSVMAEFGDVTDAIFKAQQEFLNVLKDPKNLTYFKSLSVTDQPRERPAGPIPVEEREKHVILALVAPPPSHAADTIPLIAAVFTFIDTLNKISLRPETKTKLKKARDELDRDLKDDAEREKKEELSQAKEDQRAAKRRTEQERVARLSATEQQKILEKEKKRTLRKTQGKVVRK